MTGGEEIVSTRRERREQLATRASAGTPTVAAPAAPSPSPSLRWSRRRGVMGVFAAFAAVGFVAASVGPTTMALADAQDQSVNTVSLYASSSDDIQTRGADLDAEPQTIDLGRGGYSVKVTPKVTPTVASASSSGWRPPFVTPDPGSAQAIAYDMVIARGWGDDQFACLVALWNKESGWRVNAYNASSGAYGIPQALPGSKMATAGADWETSAATQITWGLGYVGGRYGTPCGAWDHSQRTGWY